MIEAAVELDDDALDAFLDGKEPDEATLKRLIRKAVITGAFYPVLCGSAFKNKGVQPLLDAVVDYLPSPLDVPAIKGTDRTRATRSSARPTTRSRSRCSRSRSWTTRSSAPSRSAVSIRASCSRAPASINSTRDRKERIGRMLLMHANNREDIKEAYAGDIVALAGLKEARTGDTLCDLEQAGDSGKDGIPRAGHRDRDRAEVEGRPGKARCRAGEARRGRSVIPRVDRSGVRPDHPQGHGRTPSRHQGRHPQAHLQGRCQYRRAAGGVPRARDQVGSSTATPTRSRPAVPVSSPR